MKQSTVQESAAAGVARGPAIGAGTGTGPTRVLLLLSDNFLRPRSRQHWPDFAALIAHPVHADPYIGVFVELLRDPRFTTTAVDLGTLYRAEGPRGLAPALTRGMAEPHYVLLNIGNQPFCLSRGHITALRRAWPAARFVFITTDEAIDFRKVTWGYADQADLIVSLDGWLGWGEHYRDRWCFLHLVSRDLYREQAEGGRPNRLGMFGRPKSDRFAVIDHLRRKGITVDTNIEDVDRWQMLDDRDYVRRLGQSLFALVPLRMHNRDGFHLIGRLYEALYAGAVPVVEDCEILTPFEALCGPFLRYRSPSDVERIVSDPGQAAAWSRMAADASLVEKAEAFGREAFFDMLARRLSPAAIREALGAAALTEAVAQIMPRPKLVLGRLYQERLRWFGHALRRGRIGDALAEFAAMLATVRAFYRYR